MKADTKLGCPFTTPRANSVSMSNGGDGYFKDVTLRTWRRRGTSHSTNQMAISDVHARIDVGIAIPFKSMYLLVHLLYAVHDHRRCTREVGPSIRQVMTC